MGLHKKTKERVALIAWRRKEVAERWFSGEDVKSIAETLKVSPQLVYLDMDYIENHADEMMKNYIVKTVPFIVSRSIYQINQANKIVSKIANNPKTENRDRIAAALASAKTAKDIVDIVAGNKGVIEKALELDESLKGESLNELLSGYNTEEQDSKQDPNRVF